MIARPFPSVFYIVATAALALAPSVAFAAVEISAKPTANMSCSDGVCTPTAAKAVLNVNDLATIFASGDATIKSTSQNPDIEIDAAISWANTNRLTLDSYHSIAFNKPVQVTGTGALTITTNDGGSAGDFHFFDKGHVKFWDLSSSLIINGNTYKLENKIKALKGDMGNNGHEGNFALADSINAKGRVYPNSPIPIFEGNFEGLGNSISNLAVESDVRNDNVGFFGELSSPAVVRDVGLFGVIVKGEEDGQQIAALVGYFSGPATIMNCLASGIVSGTTNSSVGGLVGYDNIGTIENSIARVAVSTTGGGDVGGLVGTVDGFRDQAGIVQQSDAAGTVSGGDDAMAGGLVGKNWGGLVFNTYATGNVAGGNNAFVGGLIGGNVDETGEQSIPKSSSSYSTGVVVGGSGASVGGLFGTDASDAENSNLYWDMDTSGVNDSSRGAGNIPNDPCITGLSDAQLKSGLPAGFDKKVWKDNAKLNGGYPYMIANPPPK